MVLEEQLLPHKDLKPLYDQAIWLYVYRTFKKDAADRTAERISIRFGLTSWPQLILVDPVTLEVSQHAGRTVASFKQAFPKAQLAAKPAGVVKLNAVMRLAQAEAKAIRLESGATADAAGEKLLDEDIVVRTRALEILAEHEPKAIAKEARTLLGTPNDPFRYLVCKVLTRHPDAKANGALEDLVRKPSPSLNPNVLRIRAVQALGASGDAGSVAVIGPHAISGAYFNGLTGIAVDALAAIGRRDAAATAAVRALLLKAYPAPPDDGNERKLRACTALAKRVHKALGSSLPFPETYDAKARAALMKETP